MQPVDAGNKARQFTNDSLDKYKEAPSSSAAAETIETPKEETVPENTPAAKSPLKKYVIPFSGGGRRIIIPVTFNRRVTASMLLDTGAPGMYISKELAGKLGLLDSSENNLWTMIGGIGGATPAIFTIIDSIQVGAA
ncbi:MAG: retroviral-like aspartic protease family protein, partial [Nitrospirota bacterium]|nr:retroviral-like aspartic protease family protein [Nitrospirota bacterium]